MLVRWISCVERLTLRGGQIMVRWFSHERDMLPRWSDAGQLIFQGRRLIKSDGRIMIKWFFPRKESSYIGGQILVR